MGHAIDFYEVEVAKGTEGQIKIEALANEAAEYHSDSRSGLLSHIRWIDKTYETHEEAKKGIEMLDKGWYDQLAVKYHNYKQREKTQAILKQEERLEKLKNDLVEYYEKNAMKNKNQEFIGCKNCGSKINKNYISANLHDWNTCKVCFKPLSSATVLKAIENKKLKIQELKQKIQEMIKDNNKKGNSELMWLVKTEYHI